MGNYACAVNKWLSFRLKSTFRLATPVLFIWCDSSDAVAQRKHLWKKLCCLKEQRKVIFLEVIQLATCTYLWEFLMVLCALAVCYAHCLVYAVRGLGETLFQLTSGMLSPLRLHNVRATIVICLTWLATPWRLLRALGKSNHTIKTKVVSSIGTGLQHFPHCKTSER